MKPSNKQPASQARWPSSDRGIGPGRPELLREVNARRVLRLLRLHGPCSRADLVRYSELSAPTVSGSIAYLEKKGLVELIGPGPSNGGRPPSLLRFNSKLGYVVGADIGTSVVRVALADLNGTVLEEWVAPNHSHNTPERVAALIKSGIAKLQSHQKISSKRILGLAAGVPGITDTRAGIVLSAPILSADWQAVPLRDTLQAKTGIPAIVENDVNLAALGESWRGIARGVKNFVFLTIGSGVGAGIFVNGRLYHGSEWAAGEIGYLYVPGTEETPLAIRRPGSLESIIGAGAIRQSWQNLCNGRKKLNSGFSRDLSVAEILDLAEKGEVHAAQILQRTARILADAITDVCVILNSSLIVFGGRVGSHSALFNATSRILERNEFCRPRLALSAVGSEAPLIGSIWLALKTVEARILTSGANTSRSAVPMDSDGLLESFLALPGPD